MSRQILFNWCSLKFIEMQLKIFLRLQIYNKKDKVLFETGLSDLLKKTEAANLIKEKKNVVKGLSSINLPMTKKKFTVLRSPHVNKKAKDQFEIRMYNTLYVLSLEDNDFFFLQLLKRYCNQAKNISLKMKSYVMGEKRKKKSSTLDRTSKQTISLKNA